jgi:hypothetical protein
VANKIWSVLLLLPGLYFCHARPAAEEARKMAGAYAACTARYDRLEQEYNAVTINARSNRDPDLSIAAYNRIRAAKKAELEKLLQANEKSTLSDELQLLRSKIMIETGRIAVA